jgi:hypothetical protein
MRWRSAPTPTRPKRIAWRSRKSGDDPAKAVYFVPDGKGGHTSYDHGTRVGHFSRMEAR